LAALSKNRIAWLYTADDGTIYRVAAEKAITDQAKQGGSAYAGTGTPKPASLKMRRISVSDGAGHSRVVPVYVAGAAICTPGETINLNLASDSATFTSDGNPIPENHIRHNVTKQTT
jgi:hypothetical protein